MMTFDRQKAFDTALAGLRAQGRKSFNKESGHCFYRSPDGLKCAVGFLIPDEKYSVEKMEMFPAGYRIIREALGADAGEIAFLDMMQSHLHDDQCDDLSGLENAARDFAAIWKLTYTAPESAQ